MDQAGSEEPAMPAAVPRAAKFAEVLEFSRQAKKTESLRVQVEELSKAVENSRSEYKLLAQEAAEAAATKIESMMRLEIQTLKGECTSLVEKALDRREHLAAIARDAAEQRFQELLRETSEANDKQHRQLCEHVDSETARMWQEVHSFQEQVEVVGQRIFEAERIATDKAEESNAKIRMALVDFRMGEIRSQAEQHRQLQAAVASVAGGLVRLGEVCGVLPDPARLPELSRQDAADLLEMELSGKSIRHRIDDAWGTVSQGHHHIIDFVTQKAEQAMRRTLVSEVGDVDARVRKECVNLVSASKKEDMERPLPSLDTARARRERELGRELAGPKAGSDKLGITCASGLGVTMSDFGSTACPSDPPYSPLLSERRWSSFLEPLASESSPWPSFPPSGELSRSYPRAGASLQRPGTVGRPRTSPAEVASLVEF